MIYIVQVSFLKEFDKHVDFYNGLDKNKFHKNNVNYLQVKKIIWIYEFYRLIGNLLSLVVCVY